MRRSLSTADSIRSHPAFQLGSLINTAWALPVAKAYSPLLSQTFLSICGPTSVANVLRSVGARTGKNPLRGSGLRAMSLEQVVRESTEVMPAGWFVSAVRPPSVSALREQLRASNQPTHRFIANFSRAPLFGHGGGHHSPIGGYLEPEDLAFVLDVNSGYGPWLVPTERLYEAMSANDWTSQYPRGLARFERITAP